MQRATTDVVWACVIVFVAAWILGVLYFGIKRPGGSGSWARGLRTWLPARLGLIAAFAVIRVVGRGTDGFWRHLQYWQPVLAVVGVVVAIASTLLLLWARWVLGSMWASVPLVHEQHELRTGGPYAIVRHPIYTGLLGLILGGMLACGFGVWVLFAVLAVPWLVRRVHIEDKLMAGEFGEQYVAYRRRVPALFPLPRPR